MGFKCILGRYVLQKVDTERWYNFPPRPISISALPCKTGNREIISFTSTALELWNRERKYANKTGTVRVRSKLKVQNSRTFKDPNCIFQAPKIINKKPYPRRGHSKFRLHCDTEVCSTVLTNTVMIKASDSLLFPSTGDMHTSACFKTVNKCKIYIQAFSSTFKHLISFQALSRALKFLFQIQAFSRISQSHYEPWQCWFPELAISNAEIWIYFLKQNIRKQFYQTALGNCYGLKLPKCYCSLKKFTGSFIIMFGTLWFPIDITTSVQTERVRKASSGVA